MDGVYRVGVRSVRRGGLEAPPSDFLAVASHQLRENVKEMIDYPVTGLCKTPVLLYE
jgi:hypothetical protein